MDNLVIEFVFGSLCLLIGVVSIAWPRKVRQLGLRFYSGHDLLERFPFGGRWMRTHEKEHLLTLRFSGFVAILLGVAVLYLGITRL